MNRFHTALLSMTLASAPTFAADTPAASPEMKKQAYAIAQACHADMQRFCADVESGGGRKLACLKQHTADLAPGCRDALPKGDAMKRGAMTK
jgi:hypothetical protein